MSSQSYLFNPTERTLAAAGDGFSCPRLTTAGRTALTLTAGDKGMMVYDTTLTTLCIWNGTAWEFISDNSSTFCSVKDYGAVGDGVTDDSAAILAAITACNCVVFPSGSYLVGTQITIPSAGRQLIGFGGTILRAAALGANSVFYASTKNNLLFDGLLFAVQAGTPHSQSGGFVTIDTCHFARFTKCVFNAQIPGVATQSESLFSAIGSPNCNDLLIENNQFLYLYGNCCGANDGVGSGVNGHGVSIVGNLFYNSVDTGVGCWTNSRDVTISGNVFDKDDYTTVYNGVHVDVAGASNVTISGNSFKGNAMGVRVLRNLSYTNKRVVITGNSFSSQFQSSSEPATCIKIAHDDGTGPFASLEMDVSITSNTFNVVTWGIDVVSTVTDTTKPVTFLIDDNSFDITAASTIGVVFQRVSPTIGSLQCVPGKNAFIGTGGTATSGSMPNARLIVSRSNIQSHRSTFTITGPSAVLDQYQGDQGLYGLSYSLSACSSVVADAVLYMANKGVTVLYTNNNTIGAASSNTTSSNIWNHIPTGPQTSFLSVHPAGGSYAFDYLNAVRLI
jgi:hypothetical protein